MPGTNNTEILNQTTIWPKMPYVLWLWAEKGIFSAATMMQLRMQLLYIRCWDAARLPM